MSPIDTWARRDHLSRLGVASGTGLVRGVLPSSPGLARVDVAAGAPGQPTGDENLLAAWHRLGSNPVRLAHADGAVHVAAFLGCSSDEQVLTQGATDATVALPRGTRLRSGDRGPG